MNLLAYTPGTTLKVTDSGPAAAHLATIRDVEAWAEKRDLVLISRTEWIKLTNQE